MRKNILPLFAILAIAVTSLFSNPAKAQVKTNGEYPKNRKADNPKEQIVILWDDLLENAREKYGVSNNDFGTFKRFDMTPLQWARIW